MSSLNDDECCPKFDPALWDDKVFDWNNKKFVKDKVCSFFYMPLNFGQVMKKLDKKVRDAGAEMPDWLCLTEHTSKWNMDVYLAVDKEITDTENTKLSGKFFCKVYEGAFKDTGKWMKNFEEVCKSKNMNCKRMFMWYTTCPKCAKKFGKNYVAIIGKIE
jgi:hypothetical protein